MKATELRIGNFVGRDGNILIVEKIDIQNNIGFGLFEKSKGQHVNSGNNYYLELTEEWLLKFGFKKYGGLFYKEELGGFIQNECNGWIYEVGDNQICFFNHVHQLQNLYFALTQEELKIK